MQFDPVHSHSKSVNRRLTELREKVKARLHRFGDEVVNVVVELAADPRKIQNIFERLDLSPHTELSGQLDTLAYYIAQSGPEPFIKRVRSELRAAAEAARLDHPRDAPGGASSQISTGRYARSVPVFKISEEMKVEKAAEAKDSVPVWPEPAAAPESPAPPPASPEPVPDDIVIRELEWIESSTYSGPDRRLSSPDRRTHRDRRHQLDSVLRNRRFGRDRRGSPRGRRKSDLEGRA